MSGSAPLSSPPIPTSSSQAYPSIIDRFIMLVVRTIYKYRIDIGRLKWIMIILNFAYIAAVTDPLTPTLQQQQSQASSSNISLLDSLRWYEFYKLFYVIARPTILLHFYQSSSLDGVLVILIATTFLVIFTSLVYSITAGVTSQSSSTSSFSSTSTESYVAMLISLTFGNFFNYYPLMLFTEILTTVGFCGSFSSTSSDYTCQFLSSSSNAYSIIALLTLFTCIIPFMLFSLYFAELCITRNETGLFRQKSNSTKLLFLSLIKFALAIIVGIDGSYTFSVTLPLLWILSLLYLISTTYDFFKTIPFSSFSLQSFYLASIVQAFSLSILCIFKKENESDGYEHIASLTFTWPLISSKSHLTILLLVSYLLQKFMHIMWIRKRNNILIYVTSQESQLEKSQHQLFSRSINMLLMNQKYVIEQMPLINIGVYQQHQIYCPDPHCFCGGIDSSDNASPPSHLSNHLLKGMDDDSDVLLSNQIYEQMLRMYMRNDLLLIDVFTRSEDTQQFLRYMDHFLFVKKHTLALHKIIDIQIDSEKLKKPMTRRTRLSLIVLLEILKETMSKDIQRNINNLTVEMTSKAIEIYIQIDAIKVNLKSRIFACLDLKKSTLERMQKSFEFSQEVEDLNTVYTDFIDTTETQLIDFYNRFTTPFNQLLLIFFLSEIKGNLKRAHIIKQTHKQSDIQEYLQNKNMFIEVFSPDVVSITSTVGKKLGRIVGYSDKTPNVFGFEKQEFDYISDIKDLMPITLARYHDELVKFMMIRGRHDVVHIARTVFLKNKQNFIFQVSVFADINFYYAEELPFIFMVKVLSTPSAFLIVNSSGSIEGICENFFRLLGQPLESLPQAYKVEVKSVFPKFHELTANLKPFVTEDHPNADLSFPHISSALFHEIFFKNNNNNHTKLVKGASSAVKDRFLGSDSIQSHASVLQQRFVSNEHELIRFKSAISLQKRVLQTTKGELVYYVIEVKNVMITSSNDLVNSVDYSTSQQSLSKQTSVLRFNREYQSNYTRSGTPKNGGGGGGALDPQQNIIDVFEASSNRVLDGPRSLRLTDKQSIIEESDLESSYSSISSSQNEKLKKKSNKHPKKLPKPRREIRNKPYNNNDSQSHDNSSYYNANNGSVLDESLAFSVINKQNQQPLLPLIEIGGGVHSAPAIPDSSQNIPNVILLPNHNSNLQERSFDRQGSFTPRNITPKSIHHQISQQPHQSPSAIQQQKQRSSFSKPFTSSSAVIVNGNGLSSNDIANKQSNFDTNEDKETTSPKNHPSYAVNGSSSNSVGIKSASNKNRMTPRRDGGGGSGEKGGRKMNESSYQRYLSQQKQRNLQAKLDSVPRDLSNSSINSNAVGNQENEARNLQMASSITSEESDRTKQIDKFSFFEIFAESKSKPPSLTLLQILKIAEFLTMILTAIIFALTINSSLSDLTHRAQAIILKADIIPPLTTFLSAVRQFRPSPYSQHLFLNKSTQEFLYRQIESDSSFTNRDTLLTEIRSIEKDAFNNSYSNLTSYYAQASFKPEFTFEEISILNPYLFDPTSSSFSPSSSTPDYSTSTTFANFTQIDAFAQLYFSFKNLIVSDDYDFTGSSTTLQKNSIIYVQHNFHAFVETSSSILDTQNSQTIDTKDSLYQRIVIVSSLMILVVLILFSVINLNFNKFQRIVTQILNVITTVRTTSVEHEILRVRSIIDSLKESESIIENFQFSIRRKEYELQQFQETEERFQSKNNFSSSQISQKSTKQAKDKQLHRKRKSLNVQINQPTLSRMRFFLIASLSMLLFIIFDLVNLFINIKFLNSFNSGLQYLSTFGEMTYIVPSLLSQSCLIYDSQVTTFQQTSLTSSEVTSTKEAFNKYMNQLEDFSLSVSGIAQISLFSTSFSDSFNSLLKESLCDYVKDSSASCKAMFNGALTSGLVNALTFWKEQFNQIVGINFLNYNTESFYLNIVALLRFSNILNAAQVKYSKEVYTELDSIITTQTNIVIVCAVVFSCLIIIPKLYELIREAKSIQNRFFMAKKIVFMLPLYTLMIEDTFAKLLKAIGQHLDLKR